MLSKITNDVIVTKARQKYYFAPNKFSYKKCSNTFFLVGCQCLNCLFFILVYSFTQLDWMFEENLLIICQRDITPVDLYDEEAPPEANIGPIHFE